MNIFSARLLPLRRTGMLAAVGGRAVAWTVALCVLAGARSASADDPARWAVISATLGEPPASNALSEYVTAALSATGELVVPPEQLVQRVELEISAPYDPAPLALAERLGPAGEDVLDAVAFGDNARAIELANQLLAEAEPHLAALGRDDAAAADLANICLYGVRARLAASRRDDAVAELRRCLARVPDLVVDARLHPPPVRQLVEQEQDALPNGPTLVVQAAPGDPDGCAIRVNGRALGRTPALRRFLPPARYAVDVSCEDVLPARVHRVEVAGQGHTRLLIRGSLDRALRTRPSVSLQYEGSEPLLEQLPIHVGLIAAAAGVDRVAAIVDDGSRRTVRAFEVGGAGPGRLTGWAVVNEPVDESRSEAAVRAVLAGRGAGEAPPSPVGEERIARTRGRRAGGLTLAVAGAAGIGLGWFFWARLQERNDRFATADVDLPEYLAAQGRIDDAVPPTLIVALAGGVLLTTAMPLILPARQRAPWWAWVLGVAGLALVGAAIQQLATDGDCIDQGCTRRTQTDVRGAMLLAQAAPLVAAPVVYLVRTVGARDEPTATLSFGPAAFDLRIGF